MICRSALACILLLGHGCAPPSSSLHRVIGFADASMCEPSASFRALLDGLLENQPSGDSYAPRLANAEIPEAVRQVAGSPGLEVQGSQYRATLPLRGQWEGLALHSVAVVGLVESEEGFELWFDADREEVLRTAHRLGFDLPATGSVYREGEVLGVNVGVTARDGRSVLYCMPG